MRFGAAALEDAMGGILAHSVRLPEGRVLRKGLLLGREDLDALARAGHARVTIAMLGSEDVTEDGAAQQVAEALAGRLVNVRKPAAGRCVLRAAASGVLGVNARLIRSINQVGDAVTVATLPPDASVTSGQVVATVKTIPFGVPQKTVDDCVDAATEAPDPALHVSRFRPASAALIQTEIPGMREDSLLRDQRTLAGRLEALGGTLAFKARCAHTQADVSTTLEGVLAAAFDPVVLLGAVAIGDLADVIPAAVVDAGCTIVRFGVPLDPGHLVLIARRGEQTVLGMPGCARSPKRSGFDRILELFLAGRTPDQLDIPGMGVGGLQRED